MKNIYYSIVIVIALLIGGCSEDNCEIFIADLSSEDIMFINDFADEYLLSEEFADNVADRLIWNETTLGTNNDYEIQGSIDTTFTAFRSLGTTNATNHPILVKDLLRLGEELGLDNDPITTDASGEPNNKGIVYLRIRASIGNGGAGSDEIFSDVQGVNLAFIEQVVSGNECEPLWIVGGAIDDVFWNFTLTTTCYEQGQRVKAGFINGEKFRFFSIENDWGSSVNYNDFVDDGYTIDELLIGESEGDFNFIFDGTSGIYELIINENEKTIVLEPSGSLWAVGGATPGGWDFSGGETELVEIKPDIWQATFALTNDVFRFFQTQGVWDTNNNYTYYEEEGYTIDSRFENDGSDDANFKFTGTPGTYTLTINAIEKTITLEE